MSDGYIVEDVLSELRRVIPVPTPCR